MEGLLVIEIDTPVDTPRLRLEQVGCWSLQKIAAIPMHKINLKVYMDRC